MLSAQTNLVETTVRDNKGRPVALIRMQRRKTPINVEIVTLEKRKSDKVIFFNRKRWQAFSYHGSSKIMFGEGFNLLMLDADYLPALLKGLEEAKKFFVDAGIL